MAQTAADMKRVRQELGIARLDGGEDDNEEPITSKPGDEEVDPEEDNFAERYQRELENEEKESREESEPEAKADAPVTPPTDEYKPPTREEWEATQQYKQAAEEYDQIRQAFQQAPDQATLAYFHAMSPQQQAAFLQAAQPPTPQKTALDDLTPDKAQPQRPTLDDFDETIATGVEKAVAGNLVWLTEGPKRVQEYVNGHVEQAVQTATGRLADRTQQYVDYKAETLSNKIDALFQILGVKIEDPKGEEVEALMRQGKPVKDAVAALYAPRIQQAVEARKAAEKRQPRTPGNSSGTSSGLRKGAGFAEIAAHLTGRPLR